MSLAHRCELIFELTSSAAAEVTLTASTAATPTLLPLGLPVGGALEPNRGARLAQYELLLDRSSVCVYIYIYIYIYCFFFISLCIYGI